MDAVIARGILQRNIEQELKHPDYDHVVKLAGKYRKLITGSEIQDLLKRFNPRESEEMFKQRVNLSIAITPAIAHSVMKPFYKVPRTTPLVAKFKADKDQEKEGNAIEEEIQQRYDGFYGSDSNTGGVDYFLQNRFMELSFMDPNSWIVIEFDPFDPETEKAMPRPFEVSAKQAVHFDNTNNNPQWLQVDLDIKMIGKDGKTDDGKKHTLYADDVAIVYEQTLLKQEDVALQKGEEWVEIKEKFYIVRVFEINVGKLPAFRVGYKRDLETDGRTVVNPFHDAMCFFDKSIKTVSEYDLSQSLHTFPQKTVRLVKTCPGIPSDSHNGVCKGGRLVDGTVCPTCKGTGKPIHTSAQDVIEVELPENIKDEGFIPLSELVHYVELPIDLLRFQKECVKEFTPDAHQAVFNTTVLVQKNFAAGAAAASGSTAQPVTATQNDNDMESVYDALSPFADKYSAVWMKIVEMIIVLTDNQDKASFLHRFPSNFKLKTRERLYGEYKTATDSDMPAFVVDAITDELAENMFMDDADRLLKYRIQKQHFPFKGKSKDEIMQLLTSDDVLRETKILFNYFEDIFQELEDEYRKSNRDFYLERSEIRITKIDAKVQEIIANLKEQQPAAFRLPSLPAIPQAN
jgi:hypothetical protein